MQEFERLYGRVDIQTAWYQCTRIVKGTTASVELQGCIPDSLRDSRCEVTSFGIIATIR